MFLTLLICSQSVFHETSVSGTYTLFVKQVRVVPFLRPPLILPASVTADSLSIYLCTSKQHAYVPAC